MSADEIRELAEDCKDKANYYRNMTPCSDPEHDKWYRDAAKIESDKVSALLDYAAMVERRDKAIESMHTQLLLAAKDKRRTVSTQNLAGYFGHLERILRGEKE